MTESVAPSDHCILCSDRRDHIGGFEDFKPTYVVSTVTTQNTVVTRRPLGGHYKTPSVLSCCRALQHMVIFCVLFVQWFCMFLASASDRRRNLFFPHDHNAPPPFNAMLGLLWLFIFLSSSPAGLQHCIFWGREGS